MMEQLKRTRFYRGVTPLQGGTIAALDIGASNIKCLVAEHNSDGGANNFMNVLGFGVAPTKGIKAGSIVDMNALGDSIRVALDQAEKVAKKEAHYAYIGVSARKLHTHYITGEAALDGAEVTSAHIAAATQAAHAQFLSKKSDDEPMHVITHSYSLDDVDNVINPLGMSGRILKAHLYFITTPSSSVRNLMRCVKGCNIECLPPLLSPYVSALATLTQEEIDLGVIHIDMGGDTSSVSVFCNGVPYVNTLLAIGGNQITTDIARTLGMALTSAERVKKKFGSALAYFPSDGKTRAEFQANSANGGTDNFSRHALFRTIRPRIEDMFTNIDNYLEQHHPYAASIKSVVLTGGASELSNVQDVARMILRRDIRIGKPHHIVGLQDIAAGSDCAACVGLLHHAMRTSGDVIGTNDNQYPYISKTIQWLRRHI